MEKTSLQSRIQNMAEDLRAHTEAHEKVNTLQVMNLLLRALLAIVFYLVVFGRCYFIDMPNTGYVTAAFEIMSPTLNGT